MEVVSQHFLPSLFSAKPLRSEPRETMSSPKRKRGQPSLRCSHNVMTQWYQDEVVPDETIPEEKVHFSSGMVSSGTTSSGFLWITLIASEDTCTLLWHLMNGQTFLESLCTRLMLTNRSTIY